MASAAAFLEESGSVAVEDFQLHNAMVFEEGDGNDEEGRKMQVALDASEQASSREVQIFSKGSEGEWTCTRGRSRVVGCFYTGSK